MQCICIPFFPLLHPCLLQRHSRSQRRTRLARRELNNTNPGPSRAPVCVVFFWLREHSGHERTPVSAPWWKWDAWTTPQTFGIALRFARLSRKVRASSVRASSVRASPVREYNLVEHTLWLVVTSSRAHLPGVVLNNQREPGTQRF